MIQKEETTLKRRDFCKFIGAAFLGAVAVSSSVGCSKTEVKTDSTSCKSKDDACKSKDSCSSKDGACSAKDN